MSMKPKRRTPRDELTSVFRTDARKTTAEGVPRPTYVGEPARQQPSFFPVGVKGGVGGQFGDAPGFLNRDEVPARPKIDRAGLTLQAVREVGVVYTDQTQRKPQEQLLHGGVVDVSAACRGPARRGEGS